MIKSFLLERKSWIAMFLLQQAVLLFAAYIDPSIPFLSVLYFVYLSLLVFLVFLLFRYRKETAYYKSLREWDANLDMSYLKAPDSPFESIVEESIEGQTEQLRKSSLHLQAASEHEKDDLMSWIHEVKTPLTAMHLMIERLDEHQLKAPLLYEWLRIHHLLDQQLHQKRLSFIENDLSFQRIQLRPLVFKEIKNLQSWCIQKGIGFDIQLDSPDVHSDGKWLSFIIRQLLSNAVKYSEADDITVKSYEQNGRVHVDIEDRGIGIEPKDLPRIFEKGFTSTRMRRDHASTGMGLYLAQKAAAPLLIRISVRSEPESGTVFTLVFPKQNDAVSMFSV
ncbi:MULTISPECIES: sensor histidine kinase [Bacillus]|uniref:sensor histidine kinase n=1 Tax=Bacillus TaxID=1386 RepID=UPI00073C378D|nr:MULTISPECIES: sensor histidine kinase [Bacillus]MBL3613075.1 sensor histidine kinase [Bacillus sp. RHFS18]KAF6543676.1 sensor histidine kinase [Bacillus sp. EKM206B]KAF6543721.1 sensor histidine kinase [Bacillus sp. EKM207B]KAF6552682.1 sensor histidine kinase [Bacillus sp. EKM203B]KSW03791.1 histidine kinase [Bacillus velezensis]